MPKNVVTALERGDDVEVERLVGIARRKGWVEFVEAVGALRGALLAPPIVEWMPAVSRIFRDFDSRSSGDSCVYAILLSMEDIGNFGLYVGKSGERAQVRFLKHKTGNVGLKKMQLRLTSQKVVFERGTHLLTELTAGLNGMSACEAHWAEQKIIRLLKNVVGTALIESGEEVEPVCDSCGARLTWDDWHQ